MKLDFTGLMDDGGPSLSPGRYEVITNEDWTAKETVNENISLRVPFTVVEIGDSEGLVSSFYHTISVNGAAKDLRTSKLFTLRLLTALGIISEEDRGPKDELEADFEFGKDKNEWDSVPVHAIIVNGNRRKLSGRVAIAVVEATDKTKSGIKVERLEPCPTGQKSVSETAQQVFAAPAKATVQSANATKKFPF